MKRAPRQSAAPSPTRASCASLGTPGAGVHDFQFRLYNANSGGTQIGATQILTLSLADGLFTVPLVLASSQLAGDAYCECSPLSWARGIRTGTGVMVAAT